MPSSSGSLPYHEPDIVVILVLSSFLLLANAINYVFDRILFCGLIGQILIGIAWGAPGSNWLAAEVQNAVMQLGYLGLILIVFEGGLSTNIKTLRSNLALSSLVATIGTGTPIALSFALKGFVSITSLQAFAAGAALCSTSLGTTFTILTTSGLSQSRLGVVLSSAAMMDDIVGLVMSGIISNLGQSSSVSVAQIVRPIFVSVAFAVLTPLVCIWVLKPLTLRCQSLLSASKEDKRYQILRSDIARLVGYTGVLLALVTGASYAGTSNLFAAYLAGAVITWWDAIVVDSRHSTQHEAGGTVTEPQSAVRQKEGIVSPPMSSNSPRLGSGNDDMKPARRSSDPIEPHPLSSSGQALQSLNEMSGVSIYEKYYCTVVDTILKPFFFASIGFAIPISRMFSGGVLWRGIVYSILMTVAKLLCGLCLIRFQGPLPSPKIVLRFMPGSIKSCWPISAHRNGVAAPDRTLANTSSTPDGQANAGSQANAREMMSTAQTSPAQERSRKSVKVPKPLSLYPAAMLGTAMVARGEIGFLISSVAESGGLFQSPPTEPSSEIFLIVTWAILICTVVGPLSVGLLVRRVRRLQGDERSRGSGRADPLGIWGIATG